MHRRACELSVVEMLLRRVSSVAHVGEHESMQSVADKLTLHGVGAVLVFSDEEKLIGIISDSDFVRAASQRKGQFSYLIARDIMNPEVYTCGPEENELELLKVMTEKRAQHMAVTIDNRIVGLVGLDDAVRQQLEVAGKLTAKATVGEDSEKARSALVEHLKDNWAVFAAFKAWDDAQNEMGLASLEERAKQMLLVIGEAQSASRAVELRDLMLNQRFGTYPTVKRTIELLRRSSLVNYTSAADGRRKELRLSDRGMEVFNQFREHYLRSVNDHIKSLKIVS